MKEWQNVFFLSSAIFIFGWLTFVIFATSEEQKWAREDLEMFDDGTNNSKAQVNPGFTNSGDEITSAFRRNGMSAHETHDTYL